MPFLKTLTWGCWNNMVPRVERHCEISDTASTYTWWMLNESPACFCELVFAENTVKAVSSHKNSNSSEY